MSTTDWLALFSGNVAQLVRTLHRCWSGDLGSFNTVDEQATVGGAVLE